MKFVLIIGAGSGIAKATAAEFAKAGYGLFLAGRNMDDLKKTASDLAIRHNIESKALHFDVLDYDSHSSFFAGLDPKPSVIITAAGLLGDQAEAQNDFTAAQRTLDTNLTGLVSILNIAANHFETEKKGSIIGISSVAGDRGRMKNYIYGAAKAGFTAYLSGLRQRLHKKGVFVMSVQPGFVNTKMIEGLETPKPLTAQPEQVGKLIYNGWKAGKPVIYTPGYWRLIMFVVRSIPERIFQKLDL
ncbi:MAG: SDR family oxidoreductase [Bacteroidetes bacterium]|nr:SDR family oxidoreductase [Bacteroidota bacterium]